MRRIFLTFQRWALTGLILASSVGLATSPVHAEDKDVRQISASAKFEKIKSLAGTWKRQDLDADTFIIEFDLIANNSVLVETWIVRGKTHSLSVFHLDDDTIMATHYCPQGNQPRLTLTDTNDAGSLEFAFKDATNLPRFDQSHQHRLRLNLPTDTTPFTRSEMYLTGTDEKWSEIELERIK